MAQIDWSTVLKNALAAATTTLGTSWSTVSAAASHSVQQLAQTAQYIADNSAKLDDDDRNLLINNQKLAMQNVLLGYEDIGILVAQQAVAAAWNVIQTALTTAIGAAAKA